MNENEQGIALSEGKIVEARIDLVKDSAMNGRSYAKVGELDQPMGKLPFSIFSKIRFELMDNNLELNAQKVKLELPHYIELQAGLLHRFLSAHPEVVSDQTLIHAPKTGKISFDDEEWAFTRHGLGLEFQSVPNGVVVDVETDVCHAKLFTAWRIALYFQSLLHFEVAESSIEELLALLVLEGYLTPRGRRFYSIQHHYS